MLDDNITSVTILDVIMLNVVILNVVAPAQQNKTYLSIIYSFEYNAGVIHFLNTSGMYYKHLIIII
jgi:hypothetical protein